MFGSFHHKALENKIQKATDTDLMKLLTIFGGCYSVILQQSNDYKPYTKWQCLLLEK